MGTARGRGLPARLHERHDRHAEGRDADPRQCAVVGIESFHTDRPADGASAGRRCCRSHTSSSRRSACTTPRCRRQILYVRSRTRASSSPLASSGVDDAWSCPAGARPLLERPWSARSISAVVGRRSTGCVPSSRATCPPAVGHRSRIREPCLGGHLPPVLVSRSIPSSGVQRHGRTSGSRSSRDMARPRPGPGRARPRRSPGPARSAGPARRGQDAHRRDGEIQFHGRTVFSGLLEGAGADRPAFTEDGWYQTGDIRPADDPAGRLIPSGRTKDIIVLPNGFNVYPEDIENALRSPASATRRPRAGPGRSRRRPRPDRRRRPDRAMRGGRGRVDSRRQGGQRPPGPQPAGRRVAALAR